MGSEIVLSVMPRGYVMAFTVNWKFYRLLMKVAHRYNWHHATVCYPDGDTLYWCQWCGMRDVMKRRGYKAVISEQSVQEASGRAGEL